MSKADEIVHDNKDGYIAKKLPYGSNISAPTIKLDDVNTWKAVGVQKVNKQFFAKYGELKDEYNQMMREIEWNDLVYQSKFNFEPILGSTYYLYYDNNGDTFLSLIHPDEWEKELIGIFQLNSERKWVKK